jgi:hypothetical protein
VASVRWTTRKGSTANRETRTCFCGNTYEVYAAWIRRGGGKYCSVVCRSNDSAYQAVLSATTIGTRDMRGENNPRWKGGTSAFRSRFQATNAYKAWRKAVYTRDDYTCVECGTAGTGCNLNADHIKPFSTHPDLRLDVGNGRTLCVDCHKKTATYGWRLYNANR